MYLNLTTGVFSAMPGSLPRSTSAGQPLLLRDPLRQHPAAPRFRERAGSGRRVCRQRAQWRCLGLALEVPCEREEELVCPTAARAEMWWGRRHLTGLCEHCHRATLAWDLSVWDLSAPPAPSMQHRKVFSSVSEHKTVAFSV